MTSAVWSADLGGTVVGSAETVASGSTVWATGSVRYIPAPGILHAFTNKTITTNNMRLMAILTIKVIHYTKVA
jgi:hypothetical protein